jgi:hypothetical protein
VKKPHKPFKPRKEDFHTQVHWSLKDCVAVTAPEPKGHTRASLIMLVNDTLVNITTVAQSDGSYITLIHADQPTDVRIVEMKSDRYGAPVKP